MLISAFTNALLKSQVKALLKSQVVFVNIS